MAEAEKVGIKESLELLRGLELIGEDYAAVMADGKVDTADLAVLGKVFAQFPELSAAAQGLGDLGKELKDLDDEEMLALAGAALKIVKAFRGPRK